MWGMQHGRRWSGEIGLQLNVLVFMQKAVCGRKLNMQPWWKMGVTSCCGNYFLQQGQGAIARVDRRGGFSLKQKTKKQQDNPERKSDRGSKSAHYLKRETSCILFFQFIILCYFVSVFKTVTSKCSHIRPWIHEDIRRLKYIVCGCNITKCPKILGVCILWKFSNNSLWINSDNWKLAKLWLGRTTTL